MRLRVLLPARVLVDERVGKVSAEAVNGCFTILPRHVDYVAPLTQGLLTYVADDGGATVLAVNGGVLVKCGDDVLVSTPEAVTGPGLDALGEAVGEVFRAKAAEEQEARAALARIGTDVVQRLVELEEMEERGY